MTAPRGRVAGAAAAALGALALAGCPLPQPLPDYPAGTITPPRILIASVSHPGQAIIPVPARCAVPPRYPLGATLFDQNNLELVEARWFVNYRPDQQHRYAIQNTDRGVPADENPLELRRVVPPWTFEPYGHLPPAELGLPAALPSDPGITHVVELVVSNGFDPTPTAPEPNRSPAESFEVQVYRWTFVTVDPGAPGAPACPGP